ncbi:ABC-2 type transport system permease protein [Mucilaginibacter mallensis]|uniref:ABC-2 type transport system permease protein n=1 Tax=Mucilaginibacter mallensis TaxID=652787 RepID=A0A1H1ZQC3_MUCMA|nr:Gldg family protein [Mucilaginibacter mallensis]SDT35456.1 ABC-2 type transport system permease protein [Mucilaginibacter mallensis]
MKLILKIARAELRNLFYSPIAWFLTVAFMVECALTYTGLLNNYAITQETGGVGLTYMSQITYKTFSSPFGLFVGIMQNLYLYIPLLTMGLISREINGGTISLLYSSPVKIKEIVFGKYLAMMAYSLILLLVIGIFMVAGVFDIKAADYGILLSAALGFYLLLCAYSAIGLFMSSLTSYQIVAAVSTFVMIGILTYIGTLWQSVAFVRDLTYFLSLTGRTHHMLIGLISTNDVIYFIVIVYIFLGLTIYKLQSGRETKAWYVTGSRHLAIVFSALFIGYISSRPTLIGYLDTTANQDNTLTPNAQQIIKQLGDGKLEITAYSNFLDSYYFFGLPEQRNDYLARWEPYLRFKPDIEFHFVSYYDTPFALSYDLFSSYKGKTMKQIAEQRAKASDLNLSAFETPEQIQKDIDLKPELNRFVMKLTYKGKSTFLRVFNDQAVWPGESEVSAAFKRLLQAKMPEIAFVTGDGERRTGKKGDREYKTLTAEKTFRYALINQGFDVDTLSLGTRDIPDNITTLVLADPQNDLSAVAIQKIKAYINKGGNLLIAGEPGRQQLLNPLLKTLGVQLMNGMLEQESEDHAPTLVPPNLTKTAIRLSPILGKPSIDTLPVSMNGVSALSYHDTSGFNIQPLLVTKAGAAQNTMARNPDLDMVNTKGGADMESTGGHPIISSGFHVVRMGDGNTQNFGAKRVVKRYASMPANKNNSKETYTTALALTRQINGKQQRIIISGDADFMGNAELLRYEPKTANFYFSTALFNWLDYGQFPINTLRPDGKDNRVTVSTDRVAFLKFLYVWLLPGLILIIAAIFLIRRKRK